MSPQSANMRYAQKPVSRSMHNIKTYRFIYIYTHQGKFLSIFCCLEATGKDNTRILVYKCLIESYFYCVLMTDGVILAQMYEIFK